VRFPGSIIWRILAVVVVALGVSQVISMYLLHENVTRPRQVAGIGAFVNHLKTIRAAMETIPPQSHDTFIAKIAERDGIRITLYRGDERATPAPNIPPVNVFRERMREILGADAELYTRPSERRFFFIRFQAGGREYWIAFPRARVQSDPVGALVGWGAAGIVIALLAALSIGLWLTRPLQRMARAAEAIGRGADPEPIPEKGPSEVRAVAHALNQMKSDLRKQERDRATFLAGISHDLRTPLARLRLETEMLGVGPETQRAMVSDIEDMNAIIDQFIDFARGEASEPLSNVDLGDLARGAKERAERLGAQVEVQATPGLPPLRLRPLALQRAIDNLVGNAIKHGAGPVTVRASRAENGYVLSVLDRGAGIPEGLAERLKQPFTRRDDARSGQSGAGLGLAIADRIAVMHGGRLELLPREGGGLEARIVLPAV